MQALSEQPHVTRDLPNGLQFRLAVSGASLLCTAQCFSNAPECYPNTPMMKSSASLLCSEHSSTHNNNETKEWRGGEICSKQCTLYAYLAPPKTTCTLNPEDMCRSYADFDSEALQKLSYSLLTSFL